MNYIEKVKELLEVELKMVGTPYEDLLDVYGLLVLTVGENCTNEHIHDAWSVWQSKTQPDHKSLKPFKELTKEVQNLDEPYRQAVIKVAKLINLKNYRIKLIDLPFFYPGTDSYEKGWNNCLEQIRELNNAKEKENFIRFDESCLGNPKCPCEDCQKENVKMD